MIQGTARLETVGSERALYSFSLNSFSLPGLTRVSVCRPRQWRLADILLTSALACRRRRRTSGGMLVRTHAASRRPQLFWQRSPSLSWPVCSSRVTPPSRRRPAQTRSCRRRQARCWGPTLGALTAGRQPFLAAQSAGWPRCRRGQGRSAAVLRADRSRYMCRSQRERAQR